MKHKYKKENIVSHIVFCEISLCFAPTGHRTVCHVTVPTVHMKL